MEIGKNTCRLLVIISCMCILLVSCTLYTNTKNVKQETIEFEEITTSKTNLTTEADTFSTTMAPIGTTEYIKPEIGFYDMWGISHWFRIIGYNFTQGYVKVDYQSTAQHYDRILKNNYYSVSRFTSEGGKMAVDIWKSRSFRILDNDAVEVNNDTIWTIEERRAINEEKKWIVLKTNHAGVTEWYVPADIINWSIEPQLLGEPGSYYYEYKIK